MPGYANFKLKKAQHIVEFALLAPFIIFLFGVALEFALIVHTNYKFNASLHEAVSFIALKSKINTTDEAIINNIKEYTKILLNYRFVPYKETLDVEHIQAGDIDFLIGKYRYTSLFGASADAERNKYNFLTIIPVNSAILKNNPYNLTSEKLDELMDTLVVEDAPEDAADDAENDNDADEAEADAAEDENTVESDEAYDINIPEVAF